MRHVGSDKSQKLDSRFMQTLYVTNTKHKIPPTVFTHTPKISLTRRRNMKTNLRNVSITRLFYALCEKERRAMRNAGWIWVMIHIIQKLLGTNML